MGRAGQRALLVVKGPSTGSGRTGPLRFWVPDSVEMTRVGKGVLVPAVLLLPEEGAEGLAPGLRRVGEGEVDEAGYA